MYSVMGITGLLTEHLLIAEAQLLHTVHQAVAASIDMLRACLRACVRACVHVCNVSKHSPSPHPSFLCEPATGLAIQMDTLKTRPIPVHWPAQRPPH